MKYKPNHRNTKSDSELVRCRYKSTLGTDHNWSNPQQLCVEILKCFVDSMGQSIGKSMGSKCGKPNCICWSYSMDSSKHLQKTMFIVSWFLVHVPFKIILGTYLVKLFKQVFLFTSCRFNPHISLVLVNQRNLPSHCEAHWVTSVPGFLLYMVVNRIKDYL